MSVLADANPYALMPHPNRPVLVLAEGARLMVHASRRIVLACALLGSLAGVELVTAAEAQSASFDGRWQVVVSCSKAPDGAKAYRWVFPVQIRDGSLMGQYHTPGQSPSGTMTGNVGEDGAAVLSVRGITGDPNYSVGHVDAGYPFQYTANVNFAGTRGSGSRNETRECSLSFSKR